MKLSLIASVLGMSSVAVASPCLTVTADQIASNNGCIVQSATTPSYSWVTFSNFDFTLGTVTSLGGLAASDVTISFSSGRLGSDPHSNFPIYTLTVSGDDRWNISSGQWGFMLAYTITSANTIWSFLVSEDGASGMGTGGSSVTETVGGLTSTASTSNPHPGRVADIFSSANVTDVVINNAGSGSSNMTSFSNTFETPEPAPCLLTAGGLLGLLAYRKFRVA